MALRARPPRTDWGPLIVTSSLAAIVAAIGSFVADRFKGSDEAAQQYCEIARDVLLRIEPSPYIGVEARIAITRQAAVVVERCMREGS